MSGVRIAPGAQKESAADLRLCGVGGRFACPPLPTKPPHSPPKLGGDWEEIGMRVLSSDEPAPVFRRRGDPSTGQTSCSGTRHGLKSGGFLEADSFTVVAGGPQDLPAAHNAVEVRPRAACWSRVSTVGRRCATRWYALRALLGGRHEFVLLGSRQDRQSWLTLSSTADRSSTTRGEASAAGDAGWRVHVVEQLARAQGFDPGLQLDRLWEEEHQGRRCLLAEYTDVRRPDVLLGFWWDVDAAPGWHLTEDADVAVYLRVWLEEAFHAGGAIGERPSDDEGRRWAWPG